MQIDISSRDLGKIDSIEAIEKLVSLRDHFVVDAGCGNLNFTRKLIGQGAHVLGIDPDSAQSELNRIQLEQDPIERLQFVETTAQKLPCKDRSVDGVFFVFSLHHIPEADYPAVFSEVIRVLRPDGFVMVIEPMSCPVFDVMRLFHNEDVELAAAQRVLRETVAPAFLSAEIVTFHGFRKYDSFDQFADIFSNKSFNSLYTPEDVRKDNVREAFEQHAPDYQFEVPKQAMLLKGLR